MTKAIWGLFLAGVLAGCSTVQVGWIPVRSQDQFTDKKSCMVTVGTFYGHSTVSTRSGNLYPFVESIGGDVRVGVRSGGRFKIPVGDVQIRIDSNDAWTISTNETPLDYLSDNAAETMKAYTANMPEESRALVENAYSATMSTIARSTSPFTATNGDKARLILAEMLGGKKLIYRKIGVNGTASTTGEYELGDSLKTALKTCNIE